MIRSEKDFIRTKEAGTDELRLIFDTIPDQFDKYRPRYSEELFRFLIVKER